MCFNLRIEILIIGSVDLHVLRGRHPIVSISELRFLSLVVGKQIVECVRFNLNRFNLRIEILIIGRLRLLLVLRHTDYCFNLRIEILIIGSTLHSQTQPPNFLVSISELRFLSLVERLFVVRADELEEVSISELRFLSLVGLCDSGEYYRSSEFQSQN